MPQQISGHSPWSIVICAGSCWVSWKNCRNWKKLRVYVFLFILLALATKSLTDVASLDSMLATEWTCRLACWSSFGWHGWCRNSQRQGGDHWSRGKLWWNPNYWRSLQTCIWYIMPYLLLLRPAKHSRLSMGTIAMFPRFMAESSAGSFQFHNVPYLLGLTSWDSFEEVPTWWRSSNGSELNIFFWNTVGCFSKMSCQLHES